MESLETWQYLLVAIGALFVGIGKGGIPGVGNLTVVFMALALPPKASVGILLPILISADIFAVAVYRKHTLWPYIIRLAPWVVVGVIVGYLVFSRVDDGHVRIIIGVILLTMTSVHFFRKWQAKKNDGEDKFPHHPLFVSSTGIIGGFATMVANAAGPVAALYFMASGLPKYAFLGTAAWFYLIVNIFKIPFMVNLGIISVESFKFSASFMIYAVIGALTAPLVVKHIPQKLFETLVWVFVVIGGLKLIIP